MIHLQITMFNEQKTTFLEHCWYWNDNVRSKTKGNEHEQILLENVDREQTSDLMVEFFPYIYLKTLS